MPRMSPKLGAGILMVLALAACGSGGGHAARLQAAAIAKAKHAPRFSDFAALFPSNVGSRKCAVHAGPAGNVFDGTCTAAVKLADNGAATVTFTQDIQGRHTWVVRVEPGRKAYVVEIFRDPGSPLVEFIP